MRKYFLLLHFVAIVSLCHSQDSKPSSKKPDKRKAPVRTTAKTQPAATPGGSEKKDTTVKTTAAPPKPAGGKPAISADSAKSLLTQGISNIITAITVLSKPEVKEEKAQEIDENNICGYLKWRVENELLTYDSDGKIHVKGLNPITHKKAKHNPNSKDSSETLNPEARQVTIQIDSADVTIANDKLIMVQLYSSKYLVGVFDTAVTMEEIKGDKLIPVTKGQENVFVRMKDIFQFIKRNEARFLAHKTYTMSTKNPSITLKNQ